jgi:hypothetical protein
MAEAKEPVGGKRRAEPEKKVDAATAVNKARSTAATVIWVLAVLAAVILAAAAMVIVLDFNAKNAVVSFVRDAAGGLDVFGPFKDFEKGKKESQHSVEVKNALVNYGIYAIGYLIVGKVLERVVRP